MADEPDNLIHLLRFAIDEAEELPPVASGEQSSAAPAGRAKPRPAQAAPRPSTLRANRDDPPEGPASYLPEGCPIEPLGVLNDTYYYLDQLRQLRGLPARDHSRLGVQALFGRKIYLTEHFWPRSDKNGNVTGWRPEEGAAQLMAAAAAQGVWDPFERVRGRGAWLGEDGKLILHCGDLIYDGTRWNEPGRIGKHVYPAGGPIMQPAQVAKSGEESAGQILLDLFTTWRWHRKSLDARLLLGWCCAGMVGGAIDWRPLVWMTGGRGTGKSTLHKAIGRLFCGALLQVSDATAASLWQKLGHSTLPVTFDELEAEKDGKRAQNVIKFARQAASGGLVLRGGADHNAAEFKARSCMMFSSILIPPLMSQDRSRMAILELNEQREGDKLPDISEPRMAGLGKELLRRLMDGWERYPETLEMYRQALQDDGHNNRGADVFGTLLAMADLAMFDHLPEADDVSQQAALMKPDGLAESDDDLSDQERCLQHLLSTSIPRDGGGSRSSVASWIERASADDDEADWKVAQRMLGMYGMKVKREPTGKSFAVANAHSELARIFDGTHWEGQSGTMGVWVQALRRMPGADRSKSNERFAAAVGKCTILPIKLVTSPPDKDELRSSADMGGMLTGR